MVGGSHAVHSRERAFSDGTLNEEHTYATWVLTSIAFAPLPTLAAAQSTAQLIEYHTTDALAFDAARRDLEAGSGHPERAPRPRSGRVEWVGSVRAVTKQVNGQWQVVARHDFMPFGEDVAPPTPPQDKRLFTGKERDHETGLDYFGARHNRAGVGRSTSVDPLTEPQIALSTRNDGTGTSTLGTGRSGSSIPTAEAGRAPCSRWARQSSRAAASRRSSMASSMTSVPCSRRTQALENARGRRPRWPPK